MLEAPPVQATLLVALIFVLAVGLYIGYGLLERLAEPLISKLTGA